MKHVISLYMLLLCLAVPVYSCAQEAEEVCDTVRVENETLQQHGRYAQDGAIGERRSWKYNVGTVFRDSSVGRCFARSLGPLLLPAMALFFVWLHIAKYVWAIKIVIAIVVLSIRAYRGNTLKNRG